MDYLQHEINRYREARKARDFIPFSDLLRPKSDCFSASLVCYPQVDRILDKVRESNNRVRRIWEKISSDRFKNPKLSFEWDDDRATYTDRQLLLRISDIRNECRDYVGGLKLSRSTAYRLLTAIEDPWNRDVSRYLFRTLFSSPNKMFFELLEQERVPVESLVKDSNGNIRIYGFSFRKEAADQRGAGPKQ